MSGAFKPSLIALFLVPSGAFPSMSGFKGSGPHRTVVCLVELPELCRYQHIFLFPGLSSSIQVGW